MDDMYGLDTCRLIEKSNDIENKSSEEETDTESEDEYDNNNDNRLDEKIIIFNKKDGIYFKKSELIPDKDKAIIFNKKDGFFFNSEEFIDTDFILKNKTDIIDTRPSIGCNNNLFDTSNVSESNILDLNNNKVNKTSYNKKNKIKFKTSDNISEFKDKNHCSINISGTWRKTNSSGSTIYNNNYTYEDGIPQLKLNENGSIDFDFLKNPYNIANEELFNFFNYKQIQDKTVLQDQMNIQGDIKETYKNYNNNNNHKIKILLMIIIIASIISFCKNNKLKILIVILIIYIFYLNKSNIENFLVPNPNQSYKDINWLIDPNVSPIIKNSNINKYIIRYKNYTYDFKKKFNSLKKYKKYNKYDYNIGIILFNKFMNQIKIYNKIYCSNFSKKMNNSYKTLFIENAFYYLKESIKHFKYISLNINDKSIETSIISDNYDIYSLNKKFYKILGDIYSIAFNIIYIISRENNYQIDFDNKFLNIFTNYIYMNGPSSFMDKD